MDCVKRYLAVALVLVGVAASLAFFIAFLTGLATGGDENVLHWETRVVASRCVDIDSACVPVDSNCHASIAGPCVRVDAVLCSDAPVSATVQITWTHALIRGVYVSGGTQFAQPQAEGCVIYSDNEGDAPSLIYPVPQQVVALSGSSPSLWVVEYLAVLDSGEREVVTTDEIIIMPAGTALRDQPRHPSCTVDGCTPA
jgi:hypothetical protein